MASIENSSISQEIQQIVNNGVTPTHFQWTASLVADKYTVPIQQVNEIHIVREYDNHYSDEVRVNVTMTLGTYMNRVYPYKDNLTMTLYKKTVGEVSNSAASVATPGIENHKLRAVLVNAKDHILEGNSSIVRNEETANLAGVINVEFQLLDLALEQIRMQTVGTVMRKTTPGDAIKYFMTSISRAIQVDGVNTIKGVDMVDPDNTTVRDHIILPHGLKFSDVPGWIHQHMGGVYNGGFGFYLQAGIWYVYPLYNLDRWNSTPKNLTLLTIPPNFMPGMDRTYRKTNNQVIALLTGESKHLDDTEGRQLNHGNGLRFTDASKVLEGFGTAKDNKYAIQRVLNNTEFLAAPRRTGLNNTQLSPRRITANNFYEMSQMARRFGSHLQVKWENSDPGSLYPGMPVKFIYSANGKINEIYGTLLKAHHFMGSVTPGLLNNRFVTNTVMTLFLDNGTRLNTTNTQSA